MNPIDEDTDTLKSTVEQPVPEKKRSLLDRARERIGTFLESRNKVRQEIQGGDGRAALQAVENMRTDSPPLTERIDASCDIVQQITEEGKKRGRTSEMSGYGSNVQLNVENLIQPQDENSEAQLQIPDSLTKLFDEIQQACGYPPGDTLSTIKLSSGHDYVIEMRTKEGLPIDLTIPSPDTKDKKAKISIKVFSTTGTKREYSFDQMEKITNSLRKRSDLDSIAADALTVAEGAIDIEKTDYDKWIQADDERIAGEERAKEEQKQAEQRQADEAKAAEQQKKDEEIKKAEDEITDRYDVVGINTIEGVRGNGNKIIVTVRNRDGKPAERSGTEAYDPVHDEAEDTYYTMYLAESDNIADTISSDHLSRMGEFSIDLPSTTSSNSDKSLSRQLASDIQRTVAENFPAGRERGTELDYIKKLKAVDRYLYTKGADTPEEAEEIRSNVERIMKGEPLASAERKPLDDEAIELRDRATSTEQTYEIQRTLGQVGKLRQEVERPKSGVRQIMVGDTAVTVTQHLGQDIMLNVRGSENRGIPISMRKDMLTEGATANQSELEPLLSSVAASLQIGAGENEIGDLIARISIHGMDQDKINTVNFLSGASEEESPTKASMTPILVETASAEGDKKWVMNLGESDASVIQDENGLSVVFTSAADDEFLTGITLPNEMMGTTSGSLPNPLQTLGDILTGYSELGAQPDLLVQFLKEVRDKRSASPS